MNNPPENANRRPRVEERGPRLAHVVEADLRGCNRTVGTRDGGVRGELPRDGCEASHSLLLRRVARYKSSSQLAQRR